MAASASVSCAFFFDAGPVGEPGMHALDACALCTKPLARDRDIFMYKGDTPFCSDDCRHEQMQLDAAYARQAARAAARRQRQLSYGTWGRACAPGVLGGFRCELTGETDNMLQPTRSAKTRSLSSEAS